jgi:hypothetical protein
VRLAVFSLYCSIPFALTNVTNSYNESSRVDYCIRSIFNVNSLMIITKHSYAIFQLGMYT